MILTGQQIKWAQEQGYLSISDFNEKQLNPNSYNLRLADELMVYTDTLDMSLEAPYELRKIDKNGTMIFPNKL